MTPNCYLRSERLGRFLIGWLGQLIADGLNKLNEYQKLTNCEHRVYFEFSFKEPPQDFVWSDEDHEALVNISSGSPYWDSLRGRIAAAMEKREPALLL